MSTHSEVSRTQAVLIADDEASMRMIVRRMLESRGYKVFQASDGEEALAILKAAETGPLDLLITDVHIAGFQWRGAGTVARALIADLKIIFTSGRRPPEVLSFVEDDAKTKFLDKPFSGSELVACVGELLAR
jgi:two-component system cell cycle sensor histidine kinase/response regulator CckA